MRLTVALYNRFMNVFFFVHAQIFFIFSFLPKKKRNKVPNVIVSLTSFPKRIGYVYLVIDSLLRQFYKSCEIHLYLSEEDFPEKILPLKLRRQEKMGLKIHFEKGNMRSHKKYLYAMKNFFDLPVITVDDDIFYNADMVSSLIDSYKKYPQAVSSLRGGSITFDNKNEICSYKDWKFLKFAPPSMNNYATGGGGCLYPPHCLPKLAFDEKKIMELCPYADDLWLKIMETINCIKVCIVPHNRDVIYSFFTKTSPALSQVNNEQKQNDVQMKAMLEVFNEIHGKNDTLIEKMKEK